MAPVGKRWNRRLVLAFATAAAASALVIMSIAAPGLRAPGRGHGRVPSVASAWRLVGDISSSWRIQPGVGFQPGFSLTCPTTSTCYADDILWGSPGAEADVEVTNDGGSTWQRLVLPVTLSDTSRLVCVNADTCALLGIDDSGKATLLETTDGGQSWAALPGPGGLTSALGVADLSCATASSCVVVSSDPAGQTGAAAAYATADRGSTWTESELPSDFVPGALQCASPSTCVTVGFRQSPNGSPTAPPGVALFTSDAGSTWTTSSLPPTPGAITRLTCASPSDCMASFFAKPGSSTVLVSSDAGKSWTQAESSPHAFVAGLSCPTASECWASGMQLPNGSGQPVQVMKSGGIVSSTPDGGDAWRDAELPGGIGAVVDISCPTVTSCYAVALTGPSHGTGPPHGQSPRPLTAVLLAYKS